MGCDIHLYVEKRVDGKWIPADKWTKSEYENEGNPLTVEYNARFYSGRNYDLFAVLADVRNGYGFAGVDTGDGFKPIRKPKGLPKDASREVRAESESWGIDGHSHSWFTVAELLAYDWTQMTTKRGWINGPMFFHWCGWRRDHGEGPESYSGGISGQGIEHLAVEEMEKRIEAIKTLTHTSAPGVAAAKVEQELGRCYTQVAWKAMYSSRCGAFWSDTIPRLLRLGKPKDVRIVFWFDN
jgi:hypothetical protein